MKLRSSSQANIVYINGVYYLTISLLVLKKIDYDCHPSIRTADIPVTIEALLSAINTRYKKNIGRDMGDDF